MKPSMHFVYFFVLSCLFSFLSADEYNQKELDLARLGSATYNISFQFFEDEIWELTKSEKEQKIITMKNEFEKGKLSPLESIDLISLLSSEGRNEEENGVISILINRLDSILETNSGRFFDSQS